jgi:predicted transcriptional regulator
MTTTLSFRVEERLADELDRVAEQTGSNRSKLLDRALRDLLYRLACERDADAYEMQPFTGDEVPAPMAQVWPEAGDAAW